ncbi:MAG: GNAT family N-acetyltransferase [Inconstantimicrobium porci]|uniref:GNAT family N-acetyltransferase n=1 Tax=Inconstantimicrobium porci TaxID=2652291 RepID=UPI002A9087FE|nr:GNAT family N-acetyltransferase [Inconstantimicrobium porci]MDY5912732.1 GNAT family N-acetyltransferase [Inconstantimicrobium porci]
MIIREAEIKDFEGVHEIMRQIFELHLERRSDIYKEGEVYTLGQFENSLNNENESILVADIDGSIVGVCHMVKKDLRNILIYKIGCIAFIEDFGVHKDYKRQGIGRKLYDAAVKNAEKWNADSLELNVWEVNHEARKFYEAIGLKPKSTHMEVMLKEKGLVP